MCIYTYLYTSIPGRTSTYENILPVQELLLAAFSLPPSNFYMFLLLHVFAAFLKRRKNTKPAETANKNKSPKCGR